MSTDDLIAGLAGDLKAVGPRVPARELMLLAAIGGTELLACLAAGLVRPDFRAALSQPVLWWKMLGLALIAAVAATTAIDLLAPERLARRGIRGLGTAVILVLATGMYLYLATPIAGSLVDRLDWRHGLVCVTKMAVLALPAIATLVWLGRRGAPTDRPATALAAGIAGGGWGAFVFAFACPSNDPLYIMVWYLLGGGGVAVATWLVMPRLLRW